MGCELGDGVAHLHADLCTAPLQRLAGLEQERHAIPAGVLDEEGHGCKRFRNGLFRDRVVVEIPCTSTSTCLTTRNA